MPLLLPTGRRHHQYSLHQLHCRPFAAPKQPLRYSTVMLADLGE